MWLQDSEKMNVPGQIEWRNGCVFQVLARHIQTRTHARTHARTRARAHTHTHTHTLSLARALSLTDSFTD